MAVFAFHAVAGGEGGLAFVVFPYFMVAALSRRPAQRDFFDDVALVIAIEFHEPRLLAAVQSVGKNDQNFSLDVFSHKRGNI